MKTFLILLLLGCSPLIAQNTKVDSLVVKPLPDIPGKVDQILTVEYPGGHDPVHRHNADAFVYVLEGSIVMAVNGDKPVTLSAGQTISTPLAATQAPRSQRNSWCSCSKTKVRPF